MADYWKRDWKRRSLSARKIWERKGKHGENRVRKDSYQRENWENIWKEKWGNQNPGRESPNLGAWFRVGKVEDAGIQNPRYRWRVSVFRISLNKSTRLLRHWNLSPGVTGLKRVKGFGKVEKIRHFPDGWRYIIGGGRRSLCTVNEWVQDAESPSHPGDSL